MRMVCVAALAIGFVTVPALADEKRDLTIALAKSLGEYHVTAKNCGVGETAAMRRIIKQLVEEQATYRFITDQEFFDTGDDAEIFESARQNGACHSIKEAAAKLMKIRTQLDSYYAEARP